MLQQPLFLQILAFETHPTNVHVFGIGPPADAQYFELFLRRFQSLAAAAAAAAAAVFWLGFWCCCRACLFVALPSTAT
jgi:hypothetical protein